MVIVANDEHYVLLDYPQHLSALVELCQIYMEVNKAMLRHLGPILDLDEDFTQA